MPTPEPHGSPEMVETHWFALDRQDPTKTFYASLDYVRHNGELIYWLTAGAKKIEVNRADLEELRTALNTLPGME